MTTDTSKPLEWSELWEEMKRRFYAGDDSWVLTTKEMYWEQLEVLPPEEYFEGGFLVGEPYADHNGQTMWTAFKERGDEYFARYELRPRRLR